MSGRQGQLSRPIERTQLLADTCPMGSSSCLRCQPLLESVPSAHSSAGHSYFLLAFRSVLDAAISVNGFTRRMLARLIRAGFATARREVINKAGGRTVGRVRITEAGRRALEG
jgi:hypothetical protein